MPRCFGSRVRRRLSVSAIGVRVEGGVGSGGGACPPEDVGGTGGYEEFLAALADPLHEEHDNYLVWVGYKFDPDEFNVAAANAALQRVR